MPSEFERNYLMITKKLFEVECQRKKERNSDISFFMSPYGFMTIHKIVASNNEINISIFS